MSYYITKTVDGDFTAVISQLTDELKKVGFGIITTIDVSATLKEKIGADFKPYTILGACNPHFAHEALKLEEMLGVLLPCNVVVIDQGNGRIQVAAMEAMSAMSAIGNEALTSLAAGVSERIESVIKAL